MGFLDLYEPVFTQHGFRSKPHLVFNADEMGFGVKPKSREWVLAPKGKILGLSRNLTLTRQFFFAIHTGFFLTLGIACRHMTSTADGS